MTTNTTTMYVPPDGVKLEGPDGITVVAATDGFVTVTVPGTEQAWLAAAPPPPHGAPGVDLLIMLVSFVGGFLLARVWPPRSPLLRLDIAEILAARREIRRLRLDAERMAGELARKGPTR